jgi:hypothetical protein
MALSPAARNYYRQMKAGYDATTARYAQPSGGIDYAALRAAANQRPVAAPIQAAPVEEKKPSNPGSWLMDQLMQLGYAATQTATEGTAMINGGNPVGGVLHELNPLEFIKNLNGGNRKASPSTLLTGDPRINEEFRKVSGRDLSGPGVDLLAPNKQDNTAQKIAKGAGSLGTDIALDPLTYVTGSFVGSGIKAAGTALKGVKAAEKVGVGLEKTGEGVIKVDEFVNSLPGKAISKVKKALTKDKVNPEALATAIADAEAGAVTRNADELAAKQAEAQRVKDFVDSIVSPTGKVEPLNIAQVARGLDPEGVPYAKRGLRDTVTGEEIPYTSAKAEQKLPTQAIDDPTAAILKGAGKDFPTPFKPAPVTMQNPKTLAQDAIKQVEEEVKAAQVAETAIQSTPITAEITKDHVLDWISKNGATKVPVPEGKPISVKDLLESIRTPGIPARTKTTLNKALNEAARVGVKADRQAALDAARGASDEAVEGSARAVEGTEALPAPKTPRKGSSPAQARADASEAAAEPSIMLKSPQQIGRIKAKYRANLAADDFEYLWSKDYLDHPDMTPAQKNAEFVMRLASLRKVKASEIPRYEVFYHRQYAIRRGKTKVEADQISRMPKAKEPKAEAFNGALSKVTTADEILKASDNSAEATAQRQAERVLTGANIPPEDLKILQEVTGGTVLKKDVTGQQFNGPAEGFNFRSDIEGTQRNAEVAGVGRGVNRFVWNSKTSANLYNRLTEQIRKEQMDAIAHGAAPKWYRGDGNIDDLSRGRETLRVLMAKLKPIEDFLRAHNIQPTAGLSQKNGLPLALGDALEIMTSTKEGADFIIGRMFAGPWGKDLRKGSQAMGTLYPDALLRVLGSVLNKIDADAIKLADGNVDIMAAIANSVRRTAKAGAWDGETLKDALTHHDKYPITMGKPSKFGPKGKGGEELATGGFPVDKGGKWGPNAQGVLDQFMHVLFDDPEFRVITALAQRAQVRAAAFGQKFGDTVRELSQDTLDEFVDFVRGGASVTDAAHLLNNPEEMVKRLAQTKPIHPTKDEVWAAQKKVDENLTDIVSPADRASAKAMEGVAQAEKQIGARAQVKSRNKASIQVLEEAEREVEALAKTPDSISIQDQTIQDKATTRRRAGIWLTNHFGAAMTVDNVTGKITTNPLYRDFEVRGSMNQNYSQALNATLNKVNRMAQRDTSLVVQADQYLKHGGSAVVPQIVKDIAAELEKVTSQFFDKAVNVTKESEGLIPTFLGRGHDLGHVKSMLESSHIGLKGKFDWEEIAAKKGPRKQAEELQRQWREQTLTDPLDFYQRLSAGLSSVNAEMSMGQGAYKKLLSLGLASNAPRDGFVALTDTSMNSLTRYFPNEGTYYVDKNVIPELQKLDRLLNQTTSFADGGLMSTLTRHYDPLLGMWKSGVTIWRLGHHIRNLIGDMSLAFLSDGVKDPRYYYSAMKMLGKRAQYDSVDMLRILQDIPTEKTLGHGKDKFMVDLGGKKAEVSYDQIYDAAYDRALLKDFSVQEDLIESVDTPSYIKKFQSAIQFKGNARGRGKTFVGTLSQARDDMVRMAHLLHVLENPGLLKKDHGRAFKSFDELMDFAVQRVNKAHPDGTGLTTSERKYMRRAIPFYSWMRKSIPLVIEAAAEHPGRITIFPKFMHDMAQQFGVDSGSVSDPFPEDQMFPHWLTDTVTGPLFRTPSGKYFGADPGEVSSDTVNQWLGGGPGGALNNLADMLNPFVKTPVELKFGETFGQGIKTPGVDPVQYVGSQIPGISHIQSLTGVDPIGSVGTLVQGEGLDPLQSVQKGNRANLESSNFLNYFLGLGLQNMSTPSAINSAEIEQRNRTK